MRALLIEDDISLAGTIQLSLHARAIDTDISTLGSEGISLAQKNLYDLIIIDLMLPDIDGYEVLQKVRKLQTSPLLVLSGLGLPEEKIKGLSHGADDYIAKPFNKNEFGKRLDSLLKVPQKTNSIKINNLIINLDKHITYLDKVIIHLTIKEQTVLEILAKKHPNKIYKQDLLLSIFEEDPPALKVIDILVSKLSNKLSELSNGKINLINEKDLVSLNY